MLAHQTMHSVSNTWTFTSLNRDRKLLNLRARTWMSTSWGIRLYTFKTRFTRPTTKKLNWNRTARPRSMRICRWSNSLSENLMIWNTKTNKRKMSKLDYLMKLLMQITKCSKLMFTITESYLRLINSSKRMMWTSAAWSVFSNSTKMLSK